MGRAAVDAGVRTPCIKFPHGEYAALRRHLPPCLVTSFGRGAAKRIYLPRKGKKSTARRMHSAGTKQSVPNMPTTWITANTALYLCSVMLSVRGSKRNLIEENTTCKTRKPPRLGKNKPRLTSIACRLSRRINE